MEPVVDQQDLTNTIRVHNLWDDVDESEVFDLFRTFGPIRRVSLVSDGPVTGQRKGSAFIRFLRVEDAARAVAQVIPSNVENRLGHDHRYLRVHWAKPTCKKCGQENCIRA